MNFWSTPENRSRWAQEKCQITKETGVKDVSVLTVQKSSFTVKTCGVSALCRKTRPWHFLYILTLQRHLIDVISVYEQSVMQCGDGVTQTDVEEIQRTAVGVAVLKAWRGKKITFPKRYLFGSVKTNQSNLLYVLLTGINYRKPPEEFITLLSRALDSNVLFFYTRTNLSYTKHAFILTGTDIRVKTRCQNWN